MFSLTCRSTRRLLWDYAQRTLPEGDLEDVERHLTECHRCRADERAYARTLLCVTAGRMQAASLPHGGWRRVRERLSADHARPRPPLARFAAAGAGLACCAVLGMVWWKAQGHAAHLAQTPTRTSSEQRAEHSSVRTPLASVDGDATHAQPAPRSFASAATRIVRKPSLALEPVGDLEYVNDATDPTAWLRLREDELAALKARLDRTLRTGDDFIDVPFPRVAGSGPAGIAAAATAYEREKAVIDPRLERAVSLAVKAMSFADLCQELSKRSSVRFTASRTVSDEKVTIFCKDRQLRDLMREINRLFGFTWTRSRRPFSDEGEYQYELSQTLRAQLTEEELRNRDLNAAIVALDDAMRKPLPSGDPEVPRNLQQLSDTQRAEYFRHLQRRRWEGGAELYRRFSPSELAALRNGQTVEYGTESEQPDRRVPDDLRRPLLETAPDIHFTADGVLDQHGLLLKDLPGAGVSVTFFVDQREPGQLSLRVEPRYTYLRDGRRLGAGGRGSFELGVAQAPTAAKPENAAANRALEQQPPFRRRVSWQPEWSCPVLKKSGVPDAGRSQRPATIEEMFANQELPPMPHVTSADVWEKVFQETGMPVVADSYSRLYPLAPFIVKNETLFDALCRTGDELGVRWKKDGDFLLGRSTSFVWDKLKEVPNRHLELWHQHREQRGETSISDLLEMATFADVQLNAPGMGQAVQHCWEIPEWRLLKRPTYSARSLGSGFPWLLRAIAGLPTGVAEHAFQPSGLAIADLAPQPQAEVVRALQQWNYQPFSLAASRIRIDFVPAGRYAWYPPYDRFTSEQQLALPVVSGKSAEEALQAAKRIDPKADAGEIHRTLGILALFVLNYEGRTHSQGQPH